MKSLVEFLNEQAAQQEATGAQTISLRKAWVQSVNRLVDQMEQWLRSADHHGVLDIEVHDVEKREEGIGRYITRGIKVRLGAREVRVAPAARFVVSAAFFGVLANPEGRVDISNGESRYTLYHMKDCLEGRWLMVGEGKGYVPFDQQNFEMAMQDLLG